MHQPSLLLTVALFCLGMDSSVAAEDENYAGSTTSNLAALDMLPGIIEPTDRVTLAAPFDGVLMEVSVREGHSVRKGRVVAIMDNRVAKAALRTARESVASVSEIRLAERELENAERFLSRVVQAHRSSAASDVELDQAQSAVDLAQIKLDLAREQHAREKSQLELEQSRVATHDIRAPFSGRVIRVAGRVGESLNRADGVLALANLQSLRVDLHVPIQWFRRLKIDRRYWLAAYAPVDHPISARLISFEPQIDAATKTFRCRFEVDNSSAALPSGFAVRLIDPDQAVPDDLHRASDVSVLRAGRQGQDRPAAR